MNLEAVHQIAKAVLYEGYMLYPYRPSSVKNQQRWNFGVLCPRAYSEAQQGSEAWTVQTECLVEGDSMTELEVRVRFLHLVARSVGELASQGNELSPGELPKFRLVEELSLNDRMYQPWQEAVEQEVIVPVCNLESLVRTPITHAVGFAAGKQIEELRDSAGAIAGVLIRERHELLGEVELSVSPAGSDLFKVCVRVRNLTPFVHHDGTTRDEALLQSFVSTHTVLGVTSGRFVSLLDPPEHLRNIAASCSNLGTWPVLVGVEGQRDTILSSPIILYDYPQIAPESAGDLFDGTEIDEILSLRIMTLTDEEKREMSQSDERARQMLQRTETMPVEQLMKLHGVLRGLRPLHEDIQ